MVTKELLDNSTVQKIFIKGRSEIGLQDFVNIRVIPDDSDSSKTQSIPADEDNTDQQLYLEWIADGNSPDSEIEEQDKEQKDN